jgi:hypothetical protein
MTNDLFPAKKNNKSGYIDISGNVVIDFQFDFFGSRIFSEGIAAVSINNKVGYINNKGDFIIEPKFDSALDFSEGMAVASFDNKYGFIDKLGNWIIKPVFYRADNFKNGLAFVMDSVTSKGIFINKEGNSVLTGKNFLISKYNEGLINCPDKKGWGYIDRFGNIAIEPIYKSAYPFFESKAAVAPVKDFDGKPNRKEKCCFIDTSGKILINKLFEGADLRFSEDLCAVYDNGYGFIDKVGNVVIPCDFYFVGHFSDGLSVFKPKGKNKKYGFIDTKGNVVIEPIFTHAESFKNGLSSVIMGDKYEDFHYGYINKNGKYIWEPSR